MADKVKSQKPKIVTCPSKKEQQSELDRIFAKAKDSIDGLYTSLAYERRTVAQLTSELEKAKTIIANYSDMKEYIVTLEEKNSHLKARTKADKKVLKQVRIDKIRSDIELGIRRIISSKKDIQKQIAKIDEMPEAFVVTPDKQQVVDYIIGLYYVAKHEVSIMDVEVICVKEQLKTYKSLLFAVESVLFEPLTHRFITI